MIRYKPVTPEKAEEVRKLLLVGRELCSNGWYTVDAIARMTGVNPSCIRKINREIAKEKLTKLGVHVDGAIITNVLPKKE